MTPLGHGATAIMLAALDKRLPPRAVLIGALIPDIDFLAALFGRMNEWHRGATHSLAFVATAAVLAMLPSGPRLVRGIAMAVGVLSHLLVDSMLDTNASNGIGVPFFWPVIKTSFAPVSLISADCAGWENWQSQLACSWTSLVLETPAWLIAATILSRSSCLRRSFFDKT